MLPKGVYEVKLERPLGIAFEEIEPGRGVKVDYVVEDSNAAEAGVIETGDILLGVTAIKVIGAKFERRLIPARTLDFDTITSAIASNEPRWQRYNVVLQFMRPGVADDEECMAYLKRIGIAKDSPWVQ